MNNLAAPTASPSLSCQSPDKWLSDSSFILMLLLNIKQLHMIDDNRTAHCQTNGPPHNATVWRDVAASYAEETAIMLTQPH